MDTGSGICGPPGSAHRHHRWSDGDGHPTLQARGGAVPGRPLPRLDGQGPQRQQRAAPDHPAPGDRRDPPPLPRGWRRPDRDQHLLGDHHRPARLLFPACRGPQGSGLLQRGHRRPVPAGTHPRDEPHLGAVGPQRGRHRRRGHRRSPLCRRGDRPDAGDHFDLARRQRCRLPFGELRAIGHRLHRAGRGPDRGRCRRAAGRNHLRHAQCQGGAVRHPAGAGSVAGPSAADDLGHHHRPVGAHPHRTDGRGLLELGPPCRAHHHRLQLRPRSEGDALLRAGTAPHRRYAYLRVPQRRIARPAVADGLPGDARDPRPADPSVGRRGLAQCGRRLLRHHPAPHPGHRPGGEGAAPSQDSEAGTAPAPQRHGSLQPDPGDQLHQHRRAGQCHGLPEVLQTHPGRRLRCRVGDLQAAGRSGRADHRHQHGRGNARRRRGHVEVPQPDRRRARHRPGADHGRFVEVVGARDRPALPPGQGHRELHLAQGG